MMRWFGKVVPLEYLAGFILVCVFAYVGPYCFYAVSGLSYGWKLSETHWLLDESYTEGVTALSFVLGIGAFAYGIYRAIAFAPFKGSRYYQALSTLPYDGRKPLPAGPLLPVLQDAVLLLSAELVAGLIGIPLGIVVTLFFVAYVIFTAVFLLQWARVMEGYLLLVGVVLSLRYIHTEWVTAGLLSITAVLEWLFVRRFLLEFPWGSLKEGEGETESALESTVKQISFTSEDMREQKVGWPFAMLAPEVSEGGIGRGKALAIGLLVSLSINSIVMVTGLSPGSGPKDNDVAGFIGLSWVFLLIAIGGRVLAYVVRYRPPITFFGRLASGRLLIPSYDLVFGSPLAAAGVFAVLTSSYSLAHISYQWLLPVAWGLAMTILLGGPPSLDQWRCTGGHRIAVSKKTGGQFIQT